MKETEEPKGLRRSQRDYSMTFKLQVISEVEQGTLSYKQAQKKYGIQGRSTVLMWLRKYGNLDWNKVMHRKETPEQKLLALEAKVKQLESELAEEKLKKKFLDCMIDVAETQFGYQIRKKSLPKQSKSSIKKNK